MLEWLCAQLMEAEVSGIVGAEKNVHNPSPRDYRYGLPPPAAGYLHVKRFRYDERAPQYLLECARVIRT